MSRFQIYTDETDATDHSFEIIATIWGEPKDCDSYRTAIDTIISNSGLASTFKGIHANTISESNWKTVGKLAEGILGELKKHLSQGTLRAQITFLGKENYDSNAGYLKKLLKKELEDSKSELRKQFSSLKEIDYPALYNRIDVLMIYLKYRDRFGVEGDEFELYPDSSGKILHYKNNFFPLTGNLPIETDFQFYEIVKILANALSKIIKLRGWPVIEQRMVKFEPKKWSDDVIIQSCDILSNFFLCYLRYSVGIEHLKYKRKSNALTEILSLDFKDINEMFKIDTSGTDVCCIRKDQMLTLNLEP